MHQRKELLGFEIFGYPVHFDNNMIRLGDVQKAYLNSGGDKSEEASKPSKWLRLDSVNVLIDYLENDDEVYSRWANNGPRTVINRPNGHRGGLYVCRELAHHYASWLDVRYAVAVLRTFDKAAQGDHRNSLYIATSVAKRLYKEDLDSRVARIESEGVDPVERIKTLVSEVAYGTAGVAIDNPMELFRYLSLHTDVGAIFNRMLTSLETVMYFNSDPDESLEALVYQYRKDPDIDLLSDTIREYYDHSEH